MSSGCLEGRLSVIALCHLSCLSFSLSLKFKRVKQPKKTQKTTMTMRMTTMRSMGIKEEDSTKEDGIDKLVELLNLPSSHNDAHQLRQLSIQAHHQISLLSNDTTTTTTLDGLSDQEILDQLVQKTGIAESQFQAIDNQLSESTKEVQKMMGKAQEEIAKLKPMSERIHEEFMKYEDEYIDHYESLKPLPTSHENAPQRAQEARRQPKNSSVLIESMSEQIEWLKELGRLKLWFSVLLDFRDHTDQLVQQATQTDPLSSADSSSSSSIREIEVLADRLFELIQSYQDFSRLTPPNHFSQFNLYQYIYQIIRQSLNSLIEIISGHVAQTLENEIEWPQPSRAPLDFKSPSTKRILDSFKTAVNFQNKLHSRPDLVSLVERRPDPVDQSSVIWLPLLEGSILLKAILRPIILRFRFHFDGQRATNRLDKPEWYFNHVLDRLAEHEKFIKSDIQKLFELSGQGSTKVFNGFTVQLVKIVEKKLKRSIPGILEMKPILAHTIEKAIGFDQMIRQMHYLESDSSKTGVPSTTQWLGTVDGILSNQHWFNIWFEAEKRFVDDMCLEIISSKETWEINDEDQRPISMNLPATNSALRIQDLVEQIKSKYEGLPRLSYQAEFLVKIQVVVLEAYSQRISGVLDGFERNRLMNVVGGDSGRAKMNLGLKGLERLAKVYVSCNWILSCFRSWNDDLFYAELYEKLKQEKTPPTPEVERFLRSVEAVGALDPTLFSPSVVRFEELAKRTEAAIVRQVVQEIMTELKPYFAKRWDIEDEEGAEGSAGEVDELSREIVPAISLWKSRMNYLRQTVEPTVKLARLVKPIAKEIEAKLLLKIIFEPFSIRAITRRGGLQFHFDLVFGWLNFSTSGTTTHFGSGSLDHQRHSSLRLEKHFARVLDACTLLTHPLRPSSSEGPSSSSQLSFEELVRLCFDELLDESQLKSLLKERLQISSLTRSECQVVLKRRPECWKT
ncbi:hypothetical protein PGT21_035142 [Puccinia graminis f. sp. tritici]|uniref:RAD50-interacting protein 1 n=1 Tax=Puccinia graminis f. sp. tritici TaxID=56615 RepID=A0A5B0NAD6_PUCGR|nr:hypothetical protein PGT21_035142 [Puccinia graminis f. sp. tritici]